MAIMFLLLKVLISVGQVKNKETPYILILAVQRSYEVLHWCFWWSLHQSAHLLVSHSRSLIYCAVTVWREVTLKMK